MPKQAKELTARAVAAIKAPGLHAVGGVAGLHLQVAAGAGRSWVYRYQYAGKRHDMGLGSSDDVTLAEAREKARGARRMLLEGNDPIEGRRVGRIAAALGQAKAVRFKECAQRYITAHQAGWRNAKHAAQWPSSLETYVYPIFGDLPVQAVDVGLVLKAVEPIWHKKPETASRVRGRIESVLDWATAREYRQGENPARWRGHLENLLPRRSKVQRVEHHAALPYREIGNFVARLSEKSGVAARALEFAILTAARTGEVIGAKWHELDLRERLWTVPTQRMKSGREHRVPLSAPAMAIVERMAAIRHSEFLFPGAVADRPLSNIGLLMTLRRMGRGDLTTHGFRSTFSDWCAERTAFPAEVREMALAHAVGDKVEAAYRRGDLFEKRRQLAEVWGRYCMTPAAAGEVVPLHGRG